jgi:hypothetical protein
VVPQLELLWVYAYDEVVSNAVLIALH